jgi:hypothetical protein
MRTMSLALFALSLTLGVSAASAQESQPEADPNGTRLLFGPTGRALPKGQVYLGVYEFFLPFVQVALTDRISIGGGTPLTFGFDEGHRPFWITPKVQIVSTSSTDVAVGAIHGFSGDGDGGAGIAYAVGTHGTPRGSFTAGAGLGYTTGGGRTPIVMIAGERQVRHNLKLISENYLGKHANGIAMEGVRFFGGSLSADLALGFPIGVGEFIAFPVVNFVYRF